jgi:NADH-quinone oxidoreductase subunit K
MQQILHSSLLLVFIVLTVAAAEVAIGLGIIVEIFRQRGGDINVDDLDELKG